MSDLNQIEVEEVDFSNIPPAEEAPNPIFYEPFPWITSETVSPPALSYLQQDPLDQPFVEISSLPPLPSQSSSSSSDVGFLQPPASSSSSSNVGFLQPPPAQSSSSSSSDVGFLQPPASSSSEDVFQFPLESIVLQQQMMEEKSVEPSKKRARSEKQISVYSLNDASRYFPHQEFDISIPPNFVALQSYAVWRWGWLRIVDAATMNLVNNSCLKDIQTVFKRNEQIPEKKGTSGSVFAATLANSMFNYFVAIKHIPLGEKKQDVVVDTYKEAEVMTYLNTIVQMNICPHYPLLYQPFLCVKNGIVTELNIVQEFADGDLTKWLSVPRPEKVLMEMIFQVSVGILGALTLLNVVNNDIKTSNILFNNVLPNTRLAYEIYGKRYEINANSFLFKIADWGLVTGKLVNRDHSVPPTYVKERVVLSSFSAKEAWSKTIYVKHPLAYRVRNMPIPPHKRDFLMFFYTMLNNSSLQPEMPVSWLQNVAQYIDRHPMSTTQDIISVFHYMFSDASLRNAKTKWSSIFQVSTPINANVNIQHFIMQETMMAPVPTLNIITEKTQPRLVRLKTP